MMVMNPRRRARRGFSLAEMAMAMLVMSVVLAVTGSLIVMSSKAAAKGLAPMDVATRSSAALRVVLDEARYAISINEASATVLEFTVADRNNDGVVETIRYWWGGKATDCLMRQYNGGAAAAVSDPLSSLALAYHATFVTTSTTVDSTATTGETLLASFTGWTGITPTVRETGITGSVWTSQFFRLDKVTIPSTSPVTLTRVRFMARSPGGATTVSAEIRLPATAAAADPGTTVVGSATTVASTTFGTTQAWQSLNLSGVTFATPPDGLCLVVRGSGTNAAFVRSYTSTSAPSDTPVFLSTANAGSSWTPTASTRNQNDMPFEVYGTYTTRTTTTTDVTTYRLRSVDATLTPTGGTAVTSSVRSLNTPTVGGGLDPNPVKE
jgi:prepilin-type N-terminal cleavage/methylation domain-containing protein